MSDTFDQRACELAVYMIETGATVRLAAKHFGISKSTVHKDLSKRLPAYNQVLYRQVRQVLDLNKAQRHIRGGLATQKKYQIKYPEKLKKNIVSNNLKLLSGMLPSFDMQIKKAENRGDLVSVNHRVAEFLASYFDIIFALNEMTHPGEKRMQSICSKECKILPNRFDENLNRLFAGMFRESISDVINDMIIEIKTITKM